MRVLFPFWLVLPVQCDTHGIVERAALKMSVEVHGEPLPVSPGNTGIVVNIPEMTAIPRSLRFPGGAAGLSGPIGPW